MNWKLLMALLLILAQLYGLLLTRLRLRSCTNPIPAAVADVYDAETYARWRAYNAEKARLQLLSGVLTLALELALLLSDAYAAFAGLFPTGETQVFAVILLNLLAELLLLPLAWHNTMGIEEKYGFNRTKPGTFFADQAKEFVLGLCLITGAALFLGWAHRTLGDWLILAFVLLLTAFSLLGSLLYPVFSRLFNKFQPLPEGPLKDQLTALLEKNGFRVRAIRVMDASRRSTKSNAYFTGFGRMKTIVLYDTLVESMTPEEICAVFAHEMGHGLHHDTLRNQLLSLLRMAAIGVLAWLTLRSPALFTAFGFPEVNYGFALLLILSVEFPLAAPLFALLANHFSRRAEYRADAQAVLEGYGAAQISALNKLSRQNFSDLAPSPLLVKLTYTHPPLSERITAIERRMAEAS